MPEAPTTACLIEGSEADASEVTVTVNDVLMSGLSEDVTVTVVLPAARAWTAALFVSEETVRDTTAESPALQISEALASNGTAVAVTVSEEPFLMLIPA